MDISIEQLGLFFRELKIITIKFLRISHLHFIASFLCQNNLILTKSLWPSNPFPFDNSGNF